MSRPLPALMGLALLLPLELAVPVTAAAAPVAPNPVSLVTGAVEATTAVAEIPVAGVASSALDTLDLPLAAADGHDHDAAEAEPGFSSAGVGTLGDPTSSASEAEEELVVLTEEMDTERFDVLGVTWDDPTVQLEHVMVRTRGPLGWTDWVEIPSVDGADTTDEPGGTGELRGGTDVLVAAGSDGAQLRIESPVGAPAGLRLVLVDGGAGTERPVDGVVAAGGEQEAAAATAAMSSLSTSTTSGAGLSPADLRPAMVTRAQWGADESIRQAINFSKTIKAMYVHHTVNSNTYTREQAPAIVRGIYEFHVKGRGWSDVGYNFLVDRFGTVYEGRKYSIDRLALGVHTGGWNTDSMAVSAIGDFRSVVPSTAMTESIARVLAWKLAEYGRNPLGTVVLTAGTGSTHPVRKPGWTGPVDVISGHLDMASTACPGGEIHRRLPQIRQRTAELMSQLTREPSPTYRPYGSGTITTRVYAEVPTTWTVTVRSLCSSSPVRTFSGSGRGVHTVSWDLRDASARLVPPGVYQVRAERSTAQGVVRADSWVEILPTASSPAAACGVVRLGGENRYATAVELGRSAYPTGTEVVLVNGAQESIVDGLVAAPLAAARKAPVLLTTAQTLPAVTRTELVRRGVKKAWLVGGTGILGQGVVDELRGMGVAVERVAGSDRFATAAAVARVMGAADGVVVASGEQGSLIDAGAVSGPAAATARPILLTRQAELPTAAIEAVRALRVRQAVVVGGAGVVTEDVRRQLTGVGVQSTRMGGADRYRTSVAVAEGFGPVIGSDRVMVASGEEANLIDSLAGGALGQVTVLARPEPTTTVLAYLSRTAPRRLTVAGGPAVLGPDTVAALSLAARRDG